MADYLSPRLQVWHQGYANTTAALSSLTADAPTGVVKITVDGRATTSAATGPGSAMVRLVTVGLETFAAGGLYLFLLKSGVYYRVSTLGLSATTVAAGTRSGDLVWSFSHANPLMLGPATDLFIGADQAKKFSHTADIGDY